MPGKRIDPAHAIILPWTSHLPAICSSGIFQPETVGLRVTATDTSFLPEQSPVKHLRIFSTHNTLQKGVPRVCYICHETEILLVCFLSLLDSFIWCPFIHLERNNKPSYPVLHLNASSSFFIPTILCHHLSRILDYFVICHTKSCSASFSKPFPVLLCLKGWNRTKHSRCGQSMDVQSAKY